MLDLKLLVGSGFVVVSLLAALLMGREIRRIKTARISNRDPSSGEMFFAQFYADSGLDPELVIAVRDCIGRELEVRSNLLRPTDRFDSTLAPAEGWEATDDGLTELAECGLLVGRKLYKIDFSEIETLDDLIRGIARIELKPRMQ